MVKQTNYETWQPAQLRKAALDGKIILASERGIQALEDKIQAVKIEMETERWKLGEAARGDTDLPENTEFKEIKTRLQFELPKTLRDLGEKRLKAVPYNEPQDGKIRFGTTFEAELQFSPQEKESGSYQLLGPLEGEYVRSTAPKIVSYMTPFGKALWGHDPQVSPKLHYQVPDGTVECIIRKVR